jgi:hypothetical protein
MFAKRILSSIILLTVFFTYTTYEVQAAVIQTAGASHVISSQEMQEAVQASSQTAAEAKQAIQEFLMRADISAQIAKAGLRSSDVVARVQMLSDAEIMDMHQQIMKEELQTSTAAGWRRSGKIMTIIGLGLIAAGAAAMISNWDKDLDEGSGEEGISVAWKATGILWASAGAVLTIIGLTRRD